MSKPLLLGRNSDNCRQVPGDRVRLVTTRYSGEGTPFIESAATLTLSCIALLSFICSSEPSAWAADGAETIVMREYRQFAELATMETRFSGLHEFDRRILRSSKKLKSLRLTTPILQKAADRFANIAAMYDISIALRDRTNWSGEEIFGLFEELVFSDEYDSKRFLGKIGKGTVEKVELLKIATKLAYDARKEHSRMWNDVLPLINGAAGPNDDRFPIRIDSSSIRNASGKPLSNLTIIIKTKSSIELPADATTYVMFFDQFGIDEAAHIPSYLISKLWDHQRDLYKPGKDCFHCSLLSDECRFDDVAFDLKDRHPNAGRERTPKGDIRFAFFPSSGFKGKYDTTTPWRIPSGNPLTKSLAGRWIGKDSKTNRDFVLVFTHVRGATFFCENWAAVEKTGERTERLFLEGKVLAGKLEFEDHDFPGDPNRDRYWGTFDGKQMELNWGQRGIKSGSVSLHWEESSRVLKEQAAKKAKTKSKK